MEIKQPAAHLDQMIRQTRAHHVQLSLMADTKANMMLTIASLLVPLSIRFLNDPQYRLPAMIMISFCMLTVVLSAYAAMPKIRWLKNTGADSNLKHPMFNILFFGSFLKMSYPDFIDSMEELMNDHNLSYEAQLRELYTMGSYLEQRKYRFVRLAYMAFISGAVISSTAYIVGSFT